MNFKKRNQAMLLSSLMLVSVNTMAKPLASFVMSTCLSKNISFKHSVLETKSGYALVQIEQEDTEKLALLAHHNASCGRYFNVSQKVEKKFQHASYQSLLDEYIPKPTGLHNLKKTNYSINQKSKVLQALHEVDPQNIWNTLEGLTGFQNRSSTTDEGVDAAKWIKMRFDAMATEYARSDVKSFFVETGGHYKQPSLVTVIGTDLSSDAVVIGAHMDTLTRNEYGGDRLPGADDDGSGSASLMETARVLLASKEKLNHPVYIIWYAAEESGLVGSQAVVEHLLDSNNPIKVKAVLQMDMTGYRNRNESKIWLITDNVDRNLTQFMEGLITQYVGVDVGYSQCGYACSDHASWTRHNVPAVFPFEAKFGQYSPYIHSSKDKLETVSLEHMTNFAKLSIAFALELAS